MTVTRTPAKTRAGMVLLLAGLLTGAPGARGAEPVVTTLADYEDDSVAARVTEVENVLAEDCEVSVTAIPARGQRSLLVEIGATTPDASAACDLRFRLATPFDQADRVTTYAWIDEGSVEIAFRVHDAAGRLFETPAILLKTRHRWMRIVADLSAANLKLVSPGRPSDDSVGSKPVWPIQIRGYRIHTRAIGRQTLYLDDLQVEHRVSGAGMLRGEFKLDKVTHIYEPGTRVRAAVVLENLSRQRALPLSVEMAWLRSDGSELTTSRAPINLPASGADYRSRQAVDFSQRVADPGLYHLVARVRGPRWIRPAVFETTIAVTRTNRGLPRGRATFFGVQANLMREPAADQLLEIEVAREIGVQLLALETPWRTIEPRRSSFDFAALDKVVNLITKRDIATMIVLTEPPEWLAAGGIDHWERQAVLFEALARRYGKRICGYQPLPADPAKPGRLGAAELTAVGQIHDRLVKLRPNVEVLAPTLRVQFDDAGGVSLPTLPPDAQVSLAFGTAGDSASALATLEEFAAQNDLSWRRSHRWFHRAEALNGPGALYDAIAVLRHYVRAAAEGVGGVVWFDLRDDTSDPRHPELMQGLVRRDFSPKMPLLGLANAVGMLYGLVYAGELSGTPAGFDSALFIAGNRQVAVLFPKPNRVLPAAVAPYQLVPGELTVFDFARRARPLTRSAATPLVPTLSRPFFITLDSQRAQADPKLGLARPWLRAPGTVYCGKESTFRIEIDAPTKLARSYLQVILPAHAPVASSFSARVLRAKAGETLGFDVTLTRRDDELFQPTALSVRLSLEGQSLHVPIMLRPLVAVRPIRPEAKITDADYAIGRLLPPIPDDEEAATQVAESLHVGYQKGELYVAVALPPGAAPNAFLQVGIAAENADTHAEVRIENLNDRPRLNPAWGTAPSQVRAWRCRKAGEKGARAEFCEITIPAKSLGESGFQAGTRLLLAARYVEPQPGGWTVPFVLEWGTGLDGTRSTVGYHWVRLAEPAKNP